MYLLNVVVVALFNHMCYTSASAVALRCGHPTVMVSQLANVRSLQSIDVLDGFTDGIGEDYGTFVHIYIHVCSFWKLLT